MTAWMLSILGLWMVTSPFLIWSAETTKWNGMVVGVLAMLLGSWLRRNPAWPKFLTIVVGAWVFGSSNTQRLQLDLIPDVNAVASGLLLIAAGSTAARLRERGVDPSLSGGP
jgi:hypothetical protein